MSIFWCCEKGFHPSSVTINGNDYNKLRLIGEGGRGYVYVATMPSSTVAALGLGPKMTTPHGGECNVVDRGGGGGERDHSKHALLSSGSLQNSYDDGDPTYGGDGGDHPNRERRSSTSSSVRSSIASRVSDVFGRSRAPQVALKRVLIHNPEMHQTVLDEAEVQRSLSSHGAEFGTSPSSPSNAASESRVAGDDSMTSKARGGGRSGYSPKHSSTLRPSSHPNICNYVDSDVLRTTGGNNGPSSTNHATSELWIAMEYCMDSVTLQDVIDDRVRLGTYLTSKEVLSIALQCCSALAHLHTQTPPVTHWDFKLCNLLVTEGLGALPGVSADDGGRAQSVASGILDICQSEDYPVKLCDFGSASRTFYNPISSVQVAQAEVELERRTTLAYRSPESLDLWHKKPVGTPCDIWAFGVVLYALLFQEMPFEANTQEILSGFPRRTHPMPMWASDTGRFGVNIKGELLNLVVTRLLVREPESRATIYEVAAELVTLADRAKYPNPWLTVSKLRAPHAQQLPRFDQ